MTVDKQRELKNLRVLLIAFNPVVREGLRAILAKDEIIDVIGDAQDGHQALLHIKRASDRGRPVNVVLTESGNGKADGVLATRLIKDEFPEVAVLVLSESINDSYVIDAIHAGAGGYIFLKDMTPEVLLAEHPPCGPGGMQMKTALLHTAVENLIQNGRKTLAERTAEAAHLTEREVDVLRLMGNGDSNKIIAQPWVSPWTLPRNTSETLSTRCRHGSRTMRLLSRPRQASWQSCHDYCRSSPI